MANSKQHIRDIAEIFMKKGIGAVVISPGSRSAPLIHAFFETFGDKCISIVDERSAAYFALGMASRLRQPVVLICTSGTAVLNYAPALAEACYQQVPLIALTADRAHEWIDQQDNQTIRQKEIYRNYIKASFELPQWISTDDDLWYAHRIINESFNISMRFPIGPVHINIPLTEPLYEGLPAATEHLPVIREAEIETTVKIPAALMEDWQNANRIMIIHGQDIPGTKSGKFLKMLTADRRVIILAENISNVSDEKIISNSNLVLSVSRKTNPEYPDLIIHSGGQTVSKALSGYLRHGKKIKCWRIGEEANLIDTFQKVTEVIPYHAASVYQSLARMISRDRNAEYRNTWLKLAESANKIAETRLNHLPFSDLHVFRKLSESIPDDCILALGNSSVIRYSQLFPCNKPAEYYSNRGTSGIDGCLSTASGIAKASGKTTLAIAGDLTFLYDSNALWNRELAKNLKILVVNNRGGGIFHIIKGPSEHPSFEKFIEAFHPVNIGKLAEAYGLKFFHAENQQTFDSQWIHFLEENDSPALFEVTTDASVSAPAFRKLMVS